MRYHPFGLKDDKAALWFVRTCSVAALFAIGSLPGSASASPLRIGIDAAVLDKAELVQQVQCQQVCRPQGGQPVCYLICNPPIARGAPFSPPLLANPLRDQGPVGVPAPRHQVLVSAPLSKRYRAHVGCRASTGCLR